jgi:CubicO group peptidase (beta-lactamase class C family)
LLTVPGLAQSGSSSGGSDALDGLAARLKKRLPQLIKVAGIPGMSIAVIRDGKVFWTGSFGVKSTKTNEPVTDGTIFEAASLTKPVAAYAIFKLVDAGKIDLDTPLNKYLGNNYDVGDDERLNLITARRVLSHTSGFPNWRNRGSKTLPINFTPGEKFSYSGEGFVYLSKVAEKITGTEFGKFVKETVLAPLGMTKSSIDWEKEFYTTKVFNHDSLGVPRGQNAERGVNAAASLHTTATDYARFVIAVLEGKGLKPETRDLMIESHVKVEKQKAPEIEWGLGWGLQIGAEGKSFWHWGDNGFNKSFVIAHDKKKDGVVFFTNSANGLSFLKEVLDESFAGSQSAAIWIDYERYDSPSKLLSKAIVESSADKALREYRAKRKKDPKWKISERQMNRLGYDFLRLKRLNDAIKLFEQNTVDFPMSANTWDSLAEAHMENGDKTKAIQFYKKSLQLDPTNKNAADKIKELTDTKKQSS